MLECIKTGNEWQDPLKLSTEINRLDLKLGGGLPTNGLIEICGQSGCGKTQLCLQLSMTAQKDIYSGGLNGAVMYINTEDVFPSKRLHQLLTSPGRKIDLGSNIYVEHVSDYLNLKDCLVKKLPMLIKGKGVKLLIIDSVAALFRGTYSLMEGQARTLDLRELGAILLNLNTQHSVCVIAVNQVTACLNSNKTIPALGLAWSNLITTRIQLSRWKDTQRKFQILLSPNFPELTHYFEINSVGLADIE